MKMMATLSCGILSLVLSTANAQQVSLASNAAAKLAKNQAAVRYIEANTGLTISKATTNAELTAAIGKLSAADQIAMTILVNKYATKASDQAGAASANESLGNSLFTDKSGQVLQLASAQNSSATRAGVKEAAGACASRLNAQAMAEGTRFHANEIDAAQDAGILGGGTCVEDATKMNKVAKENLNGTAVCATRAGAQSLTGSARSDVLATCLEAELDNDGNGDVTPVQAKKALQGLNKCGWLGRSNYAGQQL